MALLLQLATYRKIMRLITLILVLLLTRVALAENQDAGKALNEFFDAEWNYDTLLEVRPAYLRERARPEIGEGFDVREFHDAVLLSGAVPLDVLEQNVTRWIATKKAARPSASPAAK